MSTAETFPTFIKIVKTSREQVPPYAAVAIGEVIDDLRYLVMRGVRYIVSWACFVTMLLSLAMAFTSPIIYVANRGEPTYVLKWFQVPIVAHPWLATFGFLALMIICFALFVAIATPYRYQTTKPGLNVRTCGTCGVRGPDRWFCGNCQGFRVAKVFTTLFWLVGLALTIVTYVLDIFIFLASLFGLKVK